MQESCKLDIIHLLAEVAELADAHDSKSCSLTRVWVRLPPPAQIDISMHEKDIQRVLDSFQAGKITNLFYTEENQAVTKTTKGLFAVIGLEPLSQDNTHPKLEKRIRKFFSSQNGVLMKTETGNITHKVDKYFYCLKL